MLEFHSIFADYAREARDIDPHDTRLKAERKTQLLEAALRTQGIGCAGTCNVPTSAIKDPTLSHAAVLLLAYFFNLTEQGYTYAPQMYEVAHDIQIGTNANAKAIRQLVESGYVKKSKKDPGKFWMDPCYYSLDPQCRSVTELKEEGRFFIQIPGAILIDPRLDKLTKIVYIALLAKASGKPFVETALTEMSDQIRITPEAFKRHILILQELDYIRISPPDTQPNIEQGTALNFGEKSRLRNRKHYSLIEKPCAKNPIVG